VLVIKKKKIKRMNKIIVPVDFSDTSKNAALYAARVAEALNASLTLINIMEPLTAGIDGSPLSDDTDGRKKITELALDNVKLSITESVPAIPVSYIAEENSSLIESLKKIIADQHADLVIMGITGNSLAERIVIGSNTINIVHENVCPVLIVPPFASYKEIKKILFATDFKNVDESTPLNYIKEVMEAFKSELYVVNVDSDHTIEQSEEFKIQKARMETLLSGYTTSYHFIKQDDFTEAISQFSADNQIDLILIMPRKHSFLSTIFTGSHTRQLAYHSHVPILAIHE
jgi:nucleotide-binding universal stress UspA family protein